MEELFKYLSFLLGRMMDDKCDNPHINDVFEVLHMALLKATEQEVWLIIKEKLTMGHLQHRISANKPCNFARVDKLIKGLFKFHDNHWNTFNARFDSKL
jgi:hypothetical protein